MRRVRGVVFVDYVRMLRRHGLGRASAHLEPADRALLAGRVEPWDWYPMETFERLGLVILDEVVGREVDSIRLWGRSQLPQLMQFFPELRSAEGPRAALGRFVEIFAKLFDFPVLTLERSDELGASITIAWGMDRAAEEAASWQTLGFIEALVEDAGGRQVRTRFSSESWRQPSTVTRLELDWLPHAQTATPVPQPWTPRLLLVDDEPLVLAGLGRMLGAMSEVTCVSNAAAALQALERRSFDVVMCDFDLGEGPNGMELLELIAQRWPDVARILHTGCAPEGAQAAVASGLIHAIAEKPVSLADLRSLVLGLRRPS